MQWTPRWFRSSLSICGSTLAQMPGDQKDESTCDNTVTDLAKVAGTLEVRNLGASWSRCENEQRQALTGL